MKKIVSVFLFGLLIFISWGCQPQTEPINGAPGIGDPYYPNLGNGGYDVEKYSIFLDVDPSTNEVSGKTIIDAKATERLASFNLDFQGLTVASVSVNKKESTFSQQDAEMTITPSKPLTSKRSFTVEVVYHGNPGTVLSQAMPWKIGWFHMSDGTINVFTEPDGASAWFPNNNHPRDKALYHFEITVPNPWIVAATGTLQKTIPDGDYTTYVIDLTEPAASYLATINIGKYVYEEMEGPDDVLIRSYFPPDFPDTYKSNFEKLPEMVEYLSSVFGPYPFKEYGVVIASSDAPFCDGAGIADETQTLSVHCPTPEMTGELVVIHELAHSWFGNSVSLENWKDTWLKEGMATYAHWLWITRDKDLEVLNNVVHVQTIGYYPSSMTGEPPSDELFRPEVYTGGALVFHALRLEVGEDEFFKIIHTYLDKYRDSYAGTDEFIAIAEEVSGRDLQDFFSSWLESTDIPEMPLK